MGHEDGRDGRIWLYKGTVNNHTGFLLLGKKIGESWWKKIINIDDKSFNCDLRDLIVSLRYNGYDKLVSVLRDNGVREEEIIKRCQ